MNKVKDRFFDIIIILGLIFLLMQISVTTSERKPESQNSTKNSAQIAPPVGDNGDHHVIQNEDQKQVSDEELKDKSIDL